MIKEIAKNFLKNDKGQKLFRKFYYLSIEMDQFHPDAEKEFLELKSEVPPAYNDLC